jgi:hypothetical protein
MKRLLFSSVLGFFLAHFFTPAWAQEVVIPDEALKSAIWYSLGKSGG